MKRKTKLKFIAVCLIFTFFCNIAVLAVGSSAAGTVGKFSETLSAKLAAATKDEKISAYVFFKDESESVLTTMKNSHAELFTTYTAAKGVTPAAEEKMATATDSQRLTAVDDVKLQQAIEVKRQLYKNHYTTSNSAVLEKHCEEADILFVSSYAPMAIVTGTARELKALALDASVTRIDLFENHEVMIPVDVDANSETRDVAYIEEHWNKNSRADYTRDVIGLTGAGVKIGQVEKGLPCLDDPYLADTTIITNEDYADDMWWTYENHATKVAQIMVGEHGIAPDATLYSACVGDTGSLYLAIDWLVSQGVNVINMSATAAANSIYDVFCEYVDNLSLLHDVHFVTTVGNEDNGDLDVNLMIGSPARAYNAITVGAYNDNNTVQANDSEILEKQYDDFREDYSQYEELPSQYMGDYENYGAFPWFGANKPNLVATGNFFWCDENANGTSYAAPQVTGVIAQLCGYAPVLKTRQSAMGAILMASCGRKLKEEVFSNTMMFSSTSFKGGVFSEDWCISGDNNQISNAQGAGKLDAYWAYMIVRDNNYWALTMEDSTVEYTKTVYITKGIDTLTRIAIFWLMKKVPSSDAEFDFALQEGLNWDIYIEFPNGNIIASSTSVYNNYEIVQFEPPLSGYYKIIISRSPSATNPTSYVGLAIW